LKKEADKSKDLTIYLSQWFILSMIIIMI